MVKYTPRALRTIVRCLASNDERIAMRAAEIILAKTLPDLQAMDIKADLGTNMNLQFILYGRKDPIQLSREELDKSGVKGIQGNTIVQGELGDGESSGLGSGVRQEKPAETKSN